jgi:hypothetical protein
MPIWQWGRKKSTVPFYSLLDVTPSRPLPEDLVAQENSEDHSAWRDNIQLQLMQEATAEDAPGFAFFIRKGNGFLQYQTPPMEGPCLLAFTTPLRAADYARLGSPDETFEYLTCCAREVVTLVKACAEQCHTTHVTIDRCPRCPTFAIIGTASFATAVDFIRLWKSWQATEIARTRLYRDYARSAARNGDLIRARDVALELVGHVTPHDVPTHLLLGKLGIRLGDKQLVREAAFFLEFLRQPAASEELRQAQRRTDWQF